MASIILLLPFNIASSPSLTAEVKGSVDFSRHNLHEGPGLLASENYLEDSLTLQSTEGGLLLLPLKLHLNTEQQWFLVNGAMCTEVHIALCASYKHVFSIFSFII